MCEITVTNLGDNLLNRKAFLVLGTVGSTVHKDGWGFASRKGEMWKCHIPMFWTTDSGEILAKKIPQDEGPFLGHIRKASQAVPVVQKNAHPFVLEGITFVHNGKLTPNNEKDFVMEEDAEDLDKDFKVQFNKDGTVKMKKVSRSDSLIFFEKFIEIWQKTLTAGDKIDEVFVKVINETMSLFHGKFALVFIIQGNFYIVRGKTAKLHISYLHKESVTDNDVLGWVVNTSAETMDNALALMSNLEQIEGRNPLKFSYPELLNEETIYKATDKNLEVLGTVKENTAPTKAQDDAWRSTANPTQGSSGSVTTKPSGTSGKKIDREYVELQEKIYRFLIEYSLHPRDLQFMFMVGYGISLKQANKAIVRHFVKKVIPRIANMTNKDNKNRMRTALEGHPLRIFRYDASLEYPWMLNPKNIQVSMAKKVSAKS